MWRILCISVSLSITLLVNVLAQPLEVEFEPLSLTGPALVLPVAMAAAGDGSGRLFICEKRGTIRIVLDDEVLEDFFLDIESQVHSTCNECGLLGLAFHPNYPTTPYLYVNYMNASNNTRIARFTVDPGNPDFADPSTEQILLSVAQPFTNHNGGDLKFGPDGYLYIALGDGGSGGDPQDNAQNPETLLGKLLRIDVDGGDPYAIPADNPFVSDPDVLDEIWALGLRNPWRFSFDRVTGDLWIGDVGQSAWEEIDFEPAGDPGGHNYGWRCYEGNAPYNLSGCLSIENYTFPVFAYPHGSAEGCPYTTPPGRSVTGGFVYRGSMYPALHGTYICVDYIRPCLWMITQDNGAFDVTPQDGTGMFANISTFGEDDDGELYAASVAGTLYRIATDAVVPITLTRFEVIPHPDGVELRWQIENSEEVTDMEVERSTDGKLFNPIGFVESRPPLSRYTYLDSAPLDVRTFYRIAFHLYDGMTDYSPVRSIHPKSANAPNVQLVTLPDGSLQVLNPEQLDLTLSLFDADGRLLHMQPINLDVMLVEEALVLVPGLYFVRFSNDVEHWTIKWVKQ